jgi:hypothetical protein
MEVQKGKGKTMQLSSEILEDYNVILENKFLHR